MFNRLIGKREAIVEDMPGVTRDRKYGQSDWNGLYFTVIDTGGLEPKTDNEVLQAMRRQTDLAIAEADLILFVVDGREGLLPQDAEIVQRMRR
jgi:GTP-binding protein